MNMKAILTAVAVAASTISIASAATPEDVAKVVALVKDTGTQVDDITRLELTIPPYNNEADRFVDVGFGNHGFKDDERQEMATAGLKAWPSTPALHLMVPVGDACALYVIDEKLDGTVSHFGHLCINDSELGTGTHAHPWVFEPYGGVQAFYDKTIEKILAAPKS